jgi:hypothetical protein
MTRSDLDTASPRAVHAAAEHRNVPVSAIQRARHTGLPEIHRIGDPVHGAASHGAVLLAGRTAAPARRRKTSPTPRGQPGRFSGVPGAARRRTSNAA